MDPIAIPSMITARVRMTSRQVLLFLVLVLVLWGGTLGIGEGLEGRTAATGNESARTMAEPSCQRGDTTGLQSVVPFGRPQGAITGTKPGVSLDKRGIRKNTGGPIAVPVLCGGATRLRRLA